MEGKDGGWRITDGGWRAIDGGWAVLFGTPCCKEKKDGVIKERPETRDSGLSTPVPVVHITSEVGEVVATEVLSSEAAVFGELCITHGAWASLIGPPIHCFAPPSHMLYWHFIASL